MRSKTSYFNSTLFRKNLTRFWPLWGGASLIGSLVPLAMLMELIQHGFTTLAFEPLEMTLTYYYTLQVAVPIISLVYAALCALVVWHYLYNARSVSLCHALPITRKGLFVTNFLSGLAMMLIPYAVTGGLTVCITLAAGFFEPAGVLVTILGVLGFSFFYFAAATFIAFITGNPFAFAAFYFIFHFLACAAELLASELMTRFYFGVLSAYEGVVEFLSPTVFFINTLYVRTDYAETVTPSGWIKSSLDSVTLENGWIIAVYALAGAAFLGCAWLLYQRRRSESAGDVVAVGWMKPVFRYGVALCAALSGGVLLYSLLWNGFQTRTTADLLPMAVCMALAGVVGYYISSMLLAKSVKVFRGSGKGALATVIAAAAICAAIALDPAGVESRIPQVEELESVRVGIYGNYGRGCGATLEAAADIQKILDLHSGILAEKDSLNRRESARSSEGSCGSAQISLSYYLSDGRPVTRIYSIGYTSEDLDRGGVISQAAALACDPALQESNIFGDIINRNITDVRLTGGYMGSLYNPETGELVNLDLTLEQARTVEAAIRRDIQAGHFGKTAFMLDYTDYENAVFYGDIQLYYSGVRRATEYDGGGTFSTNASISISTYCTETLKALEEAGVITENRVLPTRAEYKQATNDGDDFYGYYDFDSVYYGPEMAEAYLY